jgi:hypothetical protein
MISFSPAFFILATPIRFLSALVGIYSKPTKPEGILWSGGAAFIYLKIQVIIWRCMDTFLSASPWLRNGDPAVVAGSSLRRFR